MGCLNMLKGIQIAGLGVVMSASLSCLAGGLDDSSQSKVAMMCRQAVEVIPSKIDSGRLRRPPYKLNVDKNFNFNMCGAGALAEFRKQGDMIKKLFAKLTAEDRAHFNELVRAGASPQNIIPYANQEFQKRSPTLTLGSVQNIFRESVQSAGEVFHEGHQFVDQLIRNGSQLDLQISSVCTGNPLLSCLNDEDQVAAICACGVKMVTGTATLVAGGLGIKKAGGKLATVLTKSGLKLNPILEGALIEESRTSAAQLIATPAPKRIFSAGVNRVTREVVSGGADGAHSTSYSVWPHSEPLEQPWTPEYWDEEEAAEYSVPAPAPKPAPSE